MSTSGAFSDYFEDSIAQWIKGTTFPAAPSNLYVGLFTVSPSDSGGGTELTIGQYGYARATVASSAWDETTPTTLVANHNDITFSVNTGTDWGTIVAVGIFDAASGGNLIWWSAATTQKTIQVNDQYVIKSGALTLTLD
jgi:hypothetical protein